MRNPIGLFIIVLSLGCSASRNVQTQKNDGSLDGAWIPVQQTMGGKALPAAAFDKYKLSIADSTYYYGTFETDRGVLNYKGGKMDIYGKIGVNAGKHYTAIYKLENGQLTICYNLSGQKYPEAFETTGQPLYFLSVFKKE